MSPPRQDGSSEGSRGPVASSPIPKASSLSITPSLRIPLSELHFRFAPSGGPGGQRANKVSTRVELRFDVAGSPSLGPRQRARLMERLGPEIRVVADDERSQSRNRSLAIERLRQRMADALRVTPPRRPTRPSRSANERRLAAKRRTAERKQNRRPAPED
jgi:ribosome-associated protein